MAKARKPTTTLLPAERAVRQRLREEYEAGRYKWLNGLDRPMPDSTVINKVRALIDQANTRRDERTPAPAAATPTEKPVKSTTGWQTDRAKRAIEERYPNGTEGILATVIHGAIAEDLKVESDQLGIEAPSLTVVKRALGRRKK